MTNAYMEVDGNQFFMNLDGHATGREDVCAAVSCIAVTLAGYAVNAQREGRVKILKMDLGDAKAILECRGDEQFSGAFEAATIGLLQLQNQFPEQVFVEVKKE